MALELGHPEDAQYYAAQAERIKTAFNAKFLFENKTYRGEDNFNRPTQTAMAMALDLGLCPEAAREGVVQTLLADIRQNEGHLTTGVCGTKCLLSALCENGKEEVAYGLATQTTYPSWGKWIVDGLNTCCEFWDGSKSSGIYYLGGPLDAYLYRELAGIYPTKPGYEEFAVKPRVKNDLTHVSASVNTLRGKVAVAWSKPGPKQFALDVTVPVNAKATVYIPTAGPGTAAAVISENGLVIWNHGKATKNAPAISITGVQEDYVICSVGSGSYHFVLK